LKESYHKSAGENKVPFIRRLPEACITLGLEAEFFGLGLGLEARGLGLDLELET